MTIELLLKFKIPIVSSLQAFSDIRMEFFLSYQFPPISLYLQVEEQFRSGNGSDDISNIFQVRVIFVVKCEGLNLFLECRTKYLSCQPTMT